MTPLTTKSREISTPDPPPDIMMIDLNGESTNSDQPDEDDDIIVLSDTDTSVQQQMHNQNNNNMSNWDETKKNKTKNRNVLRAATPTSNRMSKKEAKVATARSLRKRKSLLKSNRVIAIGEKNNTSVIDLCDDVDDDDDDIEILEQPTSAASTTAIDKTFNKTEKQALRADNEIEQEKIESGAITEKKIATLEKAPTNTTVPTSPTLSQQTSNTNTPSTSPTFSTEDEEKPSIQNTAIVDISLLCGIEEEMMSILYSLRNKTGTELAEYLSSRNVGMTFQNIVLMMKYVTLLKFLESFGYGATDLWPSGPPPNSLESLKKTITWKNIVTIVGPRGAEIAIMATLTQSEMVLLKRSSIVEAATADGKKSATLVVNTNRAAHETFLKKFEKQAQGEEDSQDISKVDPMNSSLGVILNKHAVANARAKNIHKSACKLTTVAPTANAETFVDAWKVNRNELFTTAAHDESQGTKKRSFFKRCSVFCCTWWSIHWNNEQVICRCRHAIQRCPRLES